jgi:hypothetical protein
MIIKPNIPFTLLHECINSNKNLLYNLIFLLVNVSILLDLLDFLSLLLFQSNLLFFRFGAIFHEDQVLTLCWVLEDVSEHEEVHTEELETGLGVSTAHHTNLVEESGSVVFLSWFKTLTLKQRVCFLNYNWGHLWMIFQKFAQNLDSVTLDFLRTVTQFVDQDGEDEVFNLWLLGHKLHKDVQGQFTVVFNIVLGEIHKDICYKITIYLLYAVLLVCLHQIKVSDIAFACDLWIVLESGELDTILKNMV